MGYLKISNLYKSREILMFKECYALEKIHGTSAHVRWNDEEGVGFFSGGEKHERFKNLFDEDALTEKFKELQLSHMVLHGEAYGGKQQGMSDTYGKELKFVVFDVKVNDKWLSVPQAEIFTKDLGLEFVAYWKTTTDLDSLDHYKEMDSVQAKRNGITEPRKMEGVVLRPLMELVKNNGGRIISKHKRDDFKETKTPRKVSEEDLKVLSDAKDIAEEWVTAMRLSHVMDKIADCDITKMKEIIIAMQNDIKIEAEGEIVWSKAVEKSIGKATAMMASNYFKNSLYKD